MTSQGLTPSDDDVPSAAEVEAELEKIIKARLHLSYQDYREKLTEKPDLSKSDSTRARMARLLAKGK